MVGPGAYLDKQKSQAKKDKRESLWGQDSRFKSLESNRDANDSVGPGAYVEQNKWNKRTYNLKFLNIRNASPDIAKGKTAAPSRPAEYD